MTRWLEDLFYLIAFAVTVGLVTFSVYDGNASPTGPAVHHAPAAEGPVIVVDRAR